MTESTPNSTELSANGNLSKSDEDDVVIVTEEIDDDELDYVNKFEGGFVFYLVLSSVANKIVLLTKLSNNWLKKVAYFKEF